MRKWPCSIGEQFEEKREMRSATIFLQDYGISNQLAVKIYKTYGIDLYGVVKETPYKLAEDIQGIGFKIADDIAKKAGFAERSQPDPGRGSCMCWGLAPMKAMCICRSPCF